MLAELAGVTRSRQAAEIYKLQPVLPRILERGGYPLQELDSAHDDFAQGVRRGKLAIGQSYLDLVAGRSLSGGAQARETRGLYVGC